MARTYDGDPDDDVDRAMGIHASFLLLTRNRGLAHRVALALGARSARQAEKALRTSAMNLERVRPLSDARRAAAGPACRDPF